jgi:hypothetical protein
MAKGRKVARQNEFEFPQHGGPREGAGRKRSSALAQVPHLAREEFAARLPIHVTVRVCPDVPSLREADVYRVVYPALIAGADRGDFRMIHFSVQSNHMHWICEASNREALTFGVQGSKVRIAKTLNGHLGRKGPMFSDRYHDRILRSPREMHGTYKYVFGNSNHHGMQHSDGLDPRSSARWFHGERPSPLPEAQTWLASKGWRLWGPIDVFSEDEVA